MTATGTDEARRASEEQWRSLAFEYVSRSFGPTDALVGLHLTVESGEFFAVIGSSGCGKSTALRIAAGLETADHGEIVCDGQVITRLPSRKRGFGMVTQQNALLGTRTARRNIALPLELEHTHRSEISTRVHDDAEPAGDLTPVGPATRRALGR